MLAAIGLTCLNWEYLQNTLFRLFQRFASQNYFADKQMYSTLVSFRARYDLLMNLTAFRLQNHNLLRIKVEKSLEKVNKLAKKRNAIVHGQVSKKQVHDGKGGVAFEYVIVTNSLYGTEMRRSIKGAYEYTEVDVKEFAAAFADCADYIDGLIVEIGGIELHNEETFYQSDDADDKPDSRN